MKIFLFSLAAFFGLPLIAMVLDWCVWLISDRKLFGVEWTEDDRFWSILVFSIISFVSLMIALSK